MATITTIIDIGSNSMRMVVFKKTSRFGFHLINESKSKVKISEGCYENDGNLQEIPMTRAFNALKSFLHIANNLKSRKIICVATSALRDAPNKHIFLSKVSKELKLNIKIIDGQKEAYFGGIAALNLLACDNFTTVDIGGGSTEFTFIANNNIEQTFSLKIGTVRMKELFFDKNDFDGAKKYIISQLEEINIENINTMVGLGGTARALSRIIIKKDKYPIDTLHGFKYEAKAKFDLFDRLIVSTSQKELKYLGVRKDRYDTIATGTFIFKTILEHFNVNQVVTSGVGVREGVYLTDILRNSNHKFPVNFNVGVRSLLDRFVDDDSHSAYLGNNAKKIFDVLKPIHNLDEKYKSLLVIASKLQLIGVSINIHRHEDHAFWYILNGLNFGFTHEDKMLIATIAKFTSKSLPRAIDVKPFKTLLPDIGIIRCLNFMMTLNMALFTEFNKINYKYKLEKNHLNILSDKSQYLVDTELAKIETIKNLHITMIVNDGI